MPKPVVSSCSSSSAVPPPGLRGRTHRTRPPSELGSRTRPTLPTSCGRSPHAIRVDSTRMAPARHRGSLPCRRCRSGLSPTSTTTSRRNTKGTTAVSPTHYREMLNATYSAVKAVDPAMLVVTGGPSPYGDPPGGDRVRPVQFYRELALRAAGEEEEEEEGRLEASIRESAKLPRPGEVRRSRPQPDQHQRGGDALGHQSRRRLQPRPGSDHARAARRRGRRDGVCRVGIRSGRRRATGTATRRTPRAPRWGSRRAGPSRRCTWRGRTAPVSSSTC